MDSSQNSLSCGLVNIQSVNNKTIEVRNLINEKKFDIFCITETWLQTLNTTVIKEMTPPTHTFLHVPRATRGGGVGIFLHKSFSHVRTVKHITTNNFEYMSVHFKLSNNDFSFTIIYRPPSSCVEEFLEQFGDFLEKIDASTHKAVILGDFNFHMDLPNNTNTKKFNDLLESFGLANYVNPATANTGHTLDLVICNSENPLVCNITVADNCCLTSIHKLVTFTMHYSKQKLLKNITFRNKSNFSPTSFIDVATEKIGHSLETPCTHADLLSKSDCIECLVEVYHDICSSEYDVSCPLVNKTIVVVDRSPWFNGDTLRKKREVRKKERIWRRTKSDTARREYSSANFQYNTLIRETKIAYYKNKINGAGSDQTKLYRILNDLSKPPEMNRYPDGHTDQQLADKFLEVFKSKVENITLSFENHESDIPYSPPTTRSASLLSRFETITLDDLKIVIRKTKKTHCDLDPFPISLIVDSDNFSDFLKLLLIIVNSSITNRKFPSSEKIAFIIPLLKAAMSHLDFLSYRPISNLSFLSKVLENVMLIQLVTHLVNSNNWPDEQSAYKELYSTETTICSVVNDLLNIMDDGKCAILILLDLSAAFDTVVHDHLIADLCSIGVTDHALEYIKDYLSNRKYCVRIGTSTSSYALLDRGVPQGSVLGPILFNIYTIGLTKVLRALGVGFKMYADDTQFYFSITNVATTSDKLTTIMSSIKQWMSRKQLKLNIDKTQYMLIGKKHDLRNLNNTQLLVDGSPIELVDSVKDLGIKVDSCLSFSSQISNIVKQTAYHLRNIAFIRKYLDEESMKKLTYNCVISRIDYCNSIYYKLPNYQLRKLQNMLNRAARLVRGTPRRDHISPVLIDLHWLPIKARIVYKICTLAFNALRTNRPAYLRQLLVVHSPGGSAATRLHTDGHKLVEPRCLTNNGLRSFKAAAPRLFNKLPYEIRSTDTLHKFKRQLKTYLFALSYDVEDKTSKNFDFDMAVTR